MSQNQANFLGVQSQRITLRDHRHRQRNRHDDNQQAKFEPAKSHVKWQETVLDYPTKSAKISVNSQTGKTHE